MSKYAWRITKDMTDGISCTGMEGPADITPQQSRELLDPHAGVRFRLLDDDRNIYYYGRLVGDFDTGFEPLDDFGLPYAGCTIIQFDDGDPDINHSGKRWVDL